jgi:hypothetical protein
MNKHLGLMSAMLIGGAAMAADGIKLGGFVDAGWMWKKATPDTNTFAIMDGALSVGKTMGMGEVMLELPLTASNAADNTLAIGGDETKAYVSWKYDNGFMWKMGQFDSLFGMEASRSADRFFSSKSKMYSLTPSNHLGLMVGYDFSDALGLGLALANPTGKGTMENGNLDIAVKLNTKSDGFHVSLGALFSQAVGQDADMAFDIIAGTKMDAMTFDVEAWISKPNVGDTGFGVLGMFTYGMDEMVSLGARVEWASKLYTEGDLIGLAVGPEFAMNKEFKVRAEYGLQKYDVTGQDPTHMISLSAVHRF